MKPIHTLIVDDEPAARKALVHLLAPDPDILVIGECRGGREAVRAVRERRPELLLLDVQMPGLDGFRVLREVGADHVPVVVFVTAHDRYALKAFEAHAIDYLLKPFSDARFYEALKEAKNQVQHRRLGDLGDKIAALALYRAHPRPGGSGRDGARGPGALSRAVAGPRGRADHAGAHGRYRLDRRGGGLRAAQGGEGVPPGAGDDA
jgi:two-component system LytT family response regulator